MSSELAVGVVFRVLLPLSLTAGKVRFSFYLSVVSGSLVVLEEVLR